MTVHAHVHGVPLATRTLSPAEAARAIYLDFEGRKGRPPVLLGALYTEGKHADPRRLVLRHEIVDRRFATCANGMKLDASCANARHEVETHYLRTAVDAIVRRADKQDRVIVSWSQHELGIVQQHVGGALADDFAHFYVDGKATAKRWLRERRLQLPHDGDGPVHTLARFMGLIGWHVPPEFGTGLVGDGLGRIESALDRGRDWSTMSAGCRRAWRQIVNHNAHDCLGLRAVVHTAAIELSG